MPAAPKGLATLALLKTRLDQGKDHLGLFEPFVDDAVAHLSTDHFASADVRGAVDERHGLLLPVETVTTLLGRLARRGGVRREGGRFFKLPFTPTVDIASEKAAIQADLARLGEALVSFSSSTRHPIPTSDDALTLLIGFLQQNNVALLLQEQADEAPLGSNRSLYRVVARFVSQDALRNPELNSLLERIIEGLVLRNALLLQDLSSAAQRFDSLQVFLDSHVLFGIIGLTGIPDSVALSETIALLRDTGAVPSAFDATLAEMRRLLGMLEDHLATAEGRLTLRRTPLVRHVLSANLRHTDLKIISATLEGRLRDAAIQLRPTSPRDRRFTLDEGALALTQRAAGGSVTPQSVG